MNSVVLSSAGAIVLSGARESCYQVHGGALSSCSSSRIGDRNSSNFKTLGFPLTQTRLWITAARRHYLAQKKAVFQSEDRRIESNLLSGDRLQRFTRRLRRECAESRDGAAALSRTVYFDQQQGAAQCSH